MRKFILNKLVRDDLLEIMRGSGQVAEYRTLNDKEFLLALSDKLREEINELDVNDQKAIDELADIKEVFDELIKTLGINSDELQSVQSIRRQKIGGFTKKIFIEKLTLQDDDPWSDYYGQQPDRFTEIK